MTTDQLTGRALDEAAARAMGWRFEMGAWYRGDDTFAGNYLSGGVIPGCLNEREMLAWLTPRGVVEMHAGTRGATVKLVNVDGYLKGTGSWIGTDLREALARLVVAVAAREATDGK